jgi:hypothetical protein
MIILWVQKSRKDKKDKTQSFQEHDEMMKQFRLSHPELNVVSARDILTADGNLLAPVHAVELPEHAQN